MTRRALTCLGLAVVMVLATSAVALATARYSGGSPEDPKVSVSFVRDHGKIRRFTIERARFFCSDGDRFRDGTRVGVMDVRRAEDGTKRFSGRFTSSDGSASAHVYGRLFRRKARGTFRLVGYYDAVKCSTRTVDWRARRTTTG